jgi:hypothetical protein
MRFVLNYLVFCALYGFALSLHGNVASKYKRLQTKAFGQASSASARSSTEPLLLRAIRGEELERTPVWMMRQAGRHMQVFATFCILYIIPTAIH